ncbi:bifunctional isocitrate dehydrogenase kinase/phosphatase [Pseudocolwellia agarivorans]|uniref:bifunctional isocitrate dehydrogenase kinase/phosphatase n=1 Tax=Pseudocolwellia agarivorans TaxID=1911682 RepID=UPI000985B431|nr:bifunctional isocitrate dehydrogenase kinase/phosphatase [Pseudocolwellia agarivorans]
MENLSYVIAQKILDGFERHIFLYSEITQSAKTRFEQRQWSEVQAAAKQRTDFYEHRVTETLDQLHQEFSINVLDEALWLEIKMAYIALLATHKQPDLAESFYNSVFCNLFSRQYYHNDYIFVESTACRLDCEQPPVIYTRYQPAEKGVLNTIKDMITYPNFNVLYDDIDRDANMLINTFRQRAKKTMFQIENLQFDVLNFVFYRNKGAYIIGRVISPAGITPFIISILNDPKKGLFIDAVLTDSETMAVVFGFARAYFFVDCQHPYALVSFLRSLIPHKTRADLYSAIGFHKQGKTEFYRDFLNHLSTSNDKLELAPGIKGMVMSVFTLPSYPYVFKIIKDKFAPSKNMTKQDVKAKYRLVKHHDRVGRMADTMEYSKVAFPKSRFSAELLQELYDVAPSIIKEDGDMIVIEHLYIERRMIPLNIYLSNANDDEISDAMYGYGQAIKQLIAADIFPGDMLLKNFGVTRHGRVIFYDYDEITYMNEVNFRAIPEAKTEEQIYASEPWYSVAPADVFPEEIATFALSNKQYREAFIAQHEDLLHAKYWQNVQHNLKNKVFGDVFPYPDELRFCNLFKQADT